MTPAYLRSVIDGGSTASSKRFALVVAVITLGLSTIILSVAACLGQDVAVALGTVSVPLAGLAGHSYVAGKRTEAASAEQGGP